MKGPAKEMSPNLGLHKEISYQQGYSSTNPTFASMLPQPQDYTILLSRELVTFPTVASPAPSDTQDQDQAPQTAAVAPLAPQDT